MLNEGFSFLLFHVSSRSKISNEDLNRLSTAIPFIYYLVKLFIWPDEMMREVYKNVLMLNVSMTFIVSMELLKSFQNLNWNDLYLSLAELIIQHSLLHFKQTSSICLLIENVEKIVILQIRFLFTKHLIVYERINLLSSHVNWLYEMLSIFNIRDRNLIFNFFLLVFGKKQYFSDCFLAWLKLFLNDWKVFWSNYNERIDNAKRSFSQLFV